MISRVLFFFVGGRFWCTSKITPTKIIEGRSQKEKRSRTRIWSFLRRWIWLYATYEIKRGVQPVWIWANWTCAIFGAKVFQHWSGKVFFCISTVPKMEKFRYGNFPLRNHISAKNSRQNVSSCLDGNLPSSNLKF